MRTLLLATRNAGKVKEIRSIISEVRLEILSLLDVPDLPDIVEDGATLEANAHKKARHVFEATGLPALSDDTGLEVFSLGLKPGVFSARYAGENASYEDNYTKLLREMREIPADKRGARFRCVTVFMAPNLTEQTEGICPGSIAVEARGSGGFGYDPVFIPDGFDQTFAELPEPVKNRISHRGRALTQMKKFLVTYFS